MSAEDRKYTVGAVTFNNFMQVGMGAPLDNRDVVRRYAHLVSGIGENKYMGQVVYVTGEYDSTKDLDHPTVDDNNIVQSEVGYYYYKNDTDGWVKILLIQDGGSGGGDDSKIPVDVLPVDEPNGVAPLDENGLVPSGNLPSYVDDVVEGYGRMEGVDPNKYIVFYKKRVVDGYLYNGAFYSDSAHTTPITPSDEKYYYDKTGNALYYYNTATSQYVAFYQYEVIDGYLYNGAFYSDAEHTTEITPAANKYYRDVTNSLVYYYDTEHTEYELVAEENAPFIVGEKSKIYVDLLTEKTYRWSGTVYTEISNTQVSKPFTTNIAVGGVSIGTTIDSTMSLEDVIKKILVNVYQPRKTTNPSTTITFTGGSATVIEIGSKSNLSSFSYNYKVKGDRGVVKRSNGSSDTQLGFYTGEITKFKLYQGTTTLLKEVDLATPITTQTGEQTMNISIDSSGNFQVTYNKIVIEGYLYNGAFYKDSAHTTEITPLTPVADYCYKDMTNNVGTMYQYADSEYTQMSDNSHSTIANLTTATEQVITFNGGAYFTNGTQYKDSAGEDSTTLPAFTASELKSSSGSTIEVVCPIFANTDSAHLNTTYTQGAKSKSNLKSNESFSGKTPEQSANIGLNISFPYHSTETPFTFEIPNSWGLRGVWWWDTGFNVWRDHSGDWEAKSYPGNNDTTVNYYDKTVNGVHVNYRTYYYKSPDTIPGGRIYKVLITQNS